MNVFHIHRYLLFIFSFLLLTQYAIGADEGSFHAFPPKLTDGAYPHHYKPARTVDFQNLKLEIKILMSEMKVEGTAHYQLKPIHGDVKTIRFDAMEMEIHDVKSDPDLGLEWSYAENEIYVTFPKALDPEKDINLSISYSAQPKQGMYFTDSKHVAPVNPDQMHTLSEPFGASYWFPCADYPDDRMGTEILVTVPKEFTTLSNGQLLDSKEKGDWRTDRWKLKIPHVVYLISIVVGKFDIVRDEWNSIPVEYYVEEGLGKDARPSMGKTPAMIEFYSDYFDYPYPYEKYAQVCVRYFNAGGMEHTSATTMTDRLVIDEEARLDTDMDGLIAHELVHQWFGDLITCESWPELWLNESFATFFEPVWWEHAEGESEYLINILGKMESYFNESHQYTRPIVDNRFDDPEEMFDRHSYPKGACVMHMMRHQLGEDLFKKSIAHYLKQNAGTVADTDELMDAIEEITGKPMERFFAQWIFRPGHPKLKVTHKWLADKKKVKLTIEQTQKMEEGAAPFAFPLEIEIVTEDGAFIKTIDIAKKEETALIDCEKQPKSVNIDPSIKVLMELDHEKTEGMLIEDLKNGSTCIVRLRAARKLAEYDSDLVIEALERALFDDPFYRIQQEAADSLGKNHSKKAKDILLKACAHPHPKVRRSVVSALGKFYKDDKVDAALRERFKNDESIHVIAESARSLARVNPKNCYSTLRAGLNRKSYQNTILIAVLNALADLEEPNVYPALVKYAKDPYPRNVRITAIRLIGGLAEKIEKHQEETRELLLEYLGSASDSIRQAAISGLRELRDEKAIPHLRRVADDDHSKWVRDSADRAINEIRKDQGSELAAENAKKLDEMKDENKKLEDRIQQLEEKLEAVLKKETKENKAAEKETAEKESE